MSKIKDKKKIAIIGGSGKMGQWIALFLLNAGMEVTITGRNRKKLLAAGNKLGVKTATNISATKLADVIILSVSIGSFENVVVEIAPYIKAGQIIIDVTSIKQLPVDIMHKYFKKTVVLGAHPLFGPGANDLAGQNIILTPTTKKESVLALKIKRYLESKSARVTLMRPAQHDRKMAVVLGLSHYVGLVLADMLSGIDNLKEITGFSGTTFKLFQTLAESVISEDPELYSTLQLALPDLPDLEREFHQKAQSWATLVINKDKTGFIKRMKTVRKKIEKKSPDFVESYANMYKLLER